MADAREIKMAAREKITTYDAWKGIGAVGILFSHMSYLSAAESPFWRRAWSLFMSKGATCSTLFMLCSGFFLYYTWKDRKVGPYLKGKLKRIYPLTLIVFLMALAVDILLAGNDVVNEGVALFSGQWFFNVVANLFLFKAFVPVEATFYSFHGPSWYISVLFWFYVMAYPFVKGMHGPSRSRWLKYTRGGVFIAYAVELAVCILAHVKGWNSLWPCYVNPWFRIFGEGLAGVLLCDAIDRGRFKVQHVNAAELAAMLLFMGSFLIRNVVHLKIMAAWIQILPMGFVLIAFRSGQGRISKVLKSTPFQFLGAISFELYMTHAFVYEGLPVLVGAASRSMREWLILHGGTRFIITFILCLVTAWIAHVVMGWINTGFINKEKNTNYGRRP